MINKNQLLRRLLALCCVIFLCAALAGGQLVQLQLTNGESYAKQAAVYLTTTSTVSAARGEILDRYGRDMVVNEATFSLVLVNAAWETDGQYERLLDLAERVQADGGTLCDVLPITTEAPYEYVTTDAAALSTLSTYIKDSRTTLGLSAVQQAVADAQTKQETSPRYDEEGSVIDEVAALDATTLISAQDFLNAMRTYLEKTQNFPTGLTDQQVRTLVGLYYSMRQVNFDLRTNFTLATNISMDLISYIKEHHQQYSGVEVETEAVRKYATTYGAHMLGTVGPMWHDDWYGTDGNSGYQNNPDYSMDDEIGKTGIEKAYESYLHGTSGSSAVETDLGGDSLSGETSGLSPEPGDNVILTIDLDLQKTAEDSLAENLSTTGRGGAAVAIDPKTGEVLALASYPTYDLSTYYDPDSVKARTEDSRKPEYNRATSGVYPPGSTFKVLTAIAALEEGIIDENTTYTCDGKFEYGGQTFTCNNHEQPMTLDVTQAIKYSCNVFFYNVGKALTGEHLEQWCEKFGLGVLTGIGIAEESGHAAGPSYRAKQIEANPLTREWQGGDDVNAAIGQSDNGFTPLQLANYIAAVVNGGTLYQPTLVKSIKSYDYSEVVQEEQSNILGTIEMSEHTRNLVMTGMSEVTAEGGTAATTFANYPIKVGGKTGTAEMFENGEKFDNGLFVAFAPFDDPQIVICVVGEGAGHGSAVAPVVRDMLDTFFQAQEPDTVQSVQQENSMVP